MSMKWPRKRDFDRDNQAMLAKIENSIRKQPLNPHQGGKSFRFLDLPPELRHNVYSKVLEDYFVTHLSRFTKDKTLLTDSRLVSVSKQVRDEFLDAMVKSSPIIRTRVRNFNFGSVVAFFNRLSDAEMHKLVKDSKKGTRVTRIEFEFHVPGPDPSDGMQRWLKRLDDSAKKGFDMRFEYEWWGNLRDVERAAVTLYGPKGREEWSKIRDVAGPLLKTSEDV